MDHHLDTGRSASDTVTELSGLVPNPIRRIVVVVGWKSQTWADFKARFKPAQYRYLHQHRAVLTGPTAAESIVQALSTLARTIQHGDIVVIQRGGGPAETLIAFNDPMVVAAIKNFPAPVFTAIGHHDDCSACDMAAAASYTTPTALGEALAKVLGRQYYQRIKVQRPATTSVTSPRRPRPHAAGSAPASQPVAPAFPERLSIPHPPPPQRAHPPALQRPLTVSSPPRSNRLGTVAFILGILSVLIPGGFFIGPAVGLTLGLVAVRRHPRGFAIAGVVTSSLSLGFDLLMLAASIVSSNH